MQVNQLLDQLLVLNRLKTMARTGWVESRIVKPESVADHSFNVALLAFLLVDESNVDRNKVLKMALVHDLAESITGDIVWKRGKDENQMVKKQKDILEREALKQIFMGINDQSIMNHYLEAKKLIMEYMEQKSLEARIVKELDKLDMCIQALIYFKDFPFENVWSFLESAKGAIITKKGIQLFEEIKKRIIELEQ